MFGDPVSNPKGWKEFKLRELSTEPLAYGANTPAVPYDGKVRYIRITDICDDGTLGYDKRSPAEYDEKYLLTEGDILFARSGATVGKTFLYQASMGKAVYAGYLIKLTLNQEMILPEIVYCLTKTGYYQSFVKNVQRKMAQPNINATEYGDFIIYCPDIGLQKKFVEFYAHGNKLKFVGLDIASATSAIWFLPHWFKGSGFMVLTVSTRTMNLEP